MKQTEKLPPDADPQFAAERAAEELERLGEAPGLHSAAAAIDPATWELVRFSLWEAPRPHVPGEVQYQVLHVSRPTSTRSGSDAGRLEKAGITEG